MSDGSEIAAAKEPLLITSDAPTTTDTPVGLSIEIDNGAGIPLRVRAGQEFFLDGVACAPRYRARSPTRR